MERRLKNKRGRYEEKSLIVFLIIGLVVMFGLAKAAPIPYNWDSNYTALFHVQSAISAWDSNQNQYVINKSIWDYADTDTRPSTYHDPPAQTSLSESYSYESSEWSGESNAFSDQNGINVYSKVLTNPNVNVNSYVGSYTHGAQNGYFYMDSANKFLKVDFIFNVSGKDSPGIPNYVWGRLYWYLRDYGTELGNNYTTIADVDINREFHNINTPLTLEDHRLIPLEEGHWYYLDIYVAESLYAYQNDLVEGEMKLSLEIVPIPTAGILLLSSVLGLIGIRRKVFKD